MGNSISSAKEAAHKESNEDVKRAMRERLEILDRMVNHVLDGAKINKLPASHGPFNQVIHTGTVVEYSKQVYIVLSKPLPNDDLDTGIKNFFGRSIEDHFKKHVTASVCSVLENTKMGEHETSHMCIQLSDNALLRLDAFYYRWNFSSSETIIKGVKGVSGVLVMKREIDLAKTNFEDISNTLFLQAPLSSSEEEEEMFVAALEVEIQKIKDLRLKLGIHCEDDEEENDKEDDEEHDEEEDDKEDDKEGDKEDNVHEEENDEDDDEDDDEEHVGKNFGDFRDFQFKL